MITQPDRKQQHRQPRLADKIDRIRRTDRHGSCDRRDYRSHARTSRGRRVDHNEEDRHVHQSREGVGLRRTRDDYIVRADDPGAVLVSARKVPAVRPKGSVSVPATRSPTSLRVRSQPERLQAWPPARLALSQPATYQHLRTNMTSPRTIRADFARHCVSAQNQRSSR